MHKVCLSTKGLSRCYSTQRTWNVNSQRLLFENIAKKLQIKSEQDWYNVTQTDIIHAGGGTVLKQHNSSIINALQAIYPEVHWYPWKFRSGIPKGYWSDQTNRKGFFDWFAQKFSLKEPEDWYKITKDKIIENGGNHLLQFYHGSLQTALKEVFPEHNWQFWKFSGHVPDGYWDDVSNMKLFAQSLMERYHLDNNNIQLLTVKDINDAGGSTLIKKCGGLEHFLNKCFPECRVIKDTKMSKGQQMLANIVQLLLPQEVLLQNHSLPSVGSRPLEVDIFLPHLRLGIDYHGEYHFQHNYIYGSPEEVQKRDQEKRLKCAELGITYIEFPFWWDRSTASVAATIHQYRPDIIPIAPVGAKPVSTQSIPAYAASAIAKLESKRSLSIDAIPHFTRWRADYDPVGKWLIQCPLGTRVRYKNGSLVNMQGMKVKTNLKLDTPVEGVYKQEKLYVFDIAVDNQEYATRMAKLDDLHMDNKVVLQRVQCHSKKQFEEAVAECQTQGNVLLVMDSETTYNFRQHASFVLEEVCSANHKLTTKTLPQTDTFDKTEWVSQSRAPYMLSVSRGKSVCHSCKTRLSKNQLQIQAFGIYIAEDSQPYKVTYSLCLKDSCVIQASNTNNWRSQFPPYNFKIAIPTQTQTFITSHNLTDNLKNMLNVEWEYIP